MAIIGSAEVEVRANVRKLGRDITDSFDGLEKQADQIADRMGKSISDSLKKNLDGLTIKVNLDDSILDDIIEVEEQIKSISNQTVKINLDDSDMDKVNTYHGKTLRYDVDLDTTYLDATLARIADQKIDLKVDNKSLKKAKDDVESAISGIPESSRTIPVVPDIDSSARNFLSAKMKEVLADAERVAKKQAVDINLDADTDKIMATLEELRSYELEDLELGITVDDTDLEAVNASIESLRLYNEANAIDLQVEVHIAKALAQLEFLARKRTAEIVPKVNMAALGAAQGVLAGFTGFNIMKEHTEDFIRSLTELDKALPQLATNLALISAAVPVAGFGAGALTMLIGDIAALSGLMVPGAALIAAYSTSMMFLNNAFTKPHKEKFIPEITAQLKDFAEAVAGDFWKVAKPSYTEFAFKTLPALYKASKGLNTGMAGLASNFWDSIGAVLATDRGMNNLTETVGNIEGGMKNLGGAFEPAMQGLLTFVRVGSKYLPDLGTYITDLAEKFDSWMQTMDETGALEDWADAGINALKELGSIIGSTVGIVYSLYQAADAVGFPGLTELADGLSRVNETLKTDAAQGALIRLGTAVKDAFNTIASSLSWVGPLFTKHFDSIVGDTEGVGGVIRVMGDIVGGVLEGIGSALTNTGLVEAFFGLFESMSTAVDEFGPAFTAIGTIMEVTFNFLGSALENITPILTQFFVNLANDAELIKPSFMGMLGVIGEWGPKVMDVVGTVTNAVARWIGNLDPVLALAGVAFLALSPIIGGIGAVLFTLGGYVVTAISKFAEFRLAIQKLATSGGVIGSVFASIQGFFTSLGGALGGLAGRISAAFSGVWVAVSGVFSRMGTAASGVVSRIGGVFAPLGGRIAGVFSGLVGNIGLIFQGLLIEIRTLMGPTLTGIFSKVGGVIGGLTGKLGGLGKGFGGVAAKVATSIPGIGLIISVFITALTVSESLRKAVGTFLANAFKTLAAFVEPLIGPLMSLVGVILDVSTEIGAVLAPAFESIFNILNSLMPIVQLVAKVLGEVLGAAITVLVGAIKAAWAMIKPVLSGAVTFVSSIFNGIADIISGVIDVIVNLVTGDFAGAFESLKGIGDSVLEMLDGAFNGIIEMLVGIFEGGIDAAKESFTAIFDAILGVLDGFGLGEEAQAIIQSLIDGFGEKLDAVVQWLKDLTQKIIDSKGPPANDAVLLKPAGAAIIQSLIDGFISVVQDVITFLTDLTQQILDIVMNIVNSVVGFFQTGWSLLTSVVQTVWNGIVLVIQTVWTTIITVVQFYVNLIVTFVQTGWAFLTTIVQTIWNGIVFVIQTVWTTIITVVQFYINLIVTTVQTGWAFLTTIVQTVWNGIVLVIQTVWTILITVVTTYINLIVTIFQTGWAFLTTIVSTIWNGIVTVISTVLTTIWTIVQTGLALVVSVFTTVWTTAINIVRTVWTAITTVITTVLTTIRTVITTILTGIMTVITTIWNSIKNVTMIVWNALKMLISLALAAVKALITGNFNQFRAIIQAAWNVIRATTSAVWNAIRSAISSVLNTIRSVISSVFNSIRSTISSVMNSIRSTISSVWNAIRSTVSSVVNAVRSAVSSAFNSIRSTISSVMNSVRSTISSVWNSIRSTISSAISSVRSTVSSGFNSIRSAISNAMNSAKSLLMSAWNAMVSTVRSKVSSMMGIVRGIPGQIRGALGNLGSLLTGAGRSIIQGLIDGVSGMIGSLKGKFSSITNMIPDWKGPPDTDAKLLTNAGELIMEGLINGLESKYGAVKNSLQGFTGDLSQTVGTQIGADVGLTTSVRKTALSDAERRLSYRSGSQSMVESNGGVGGEVHLHFYQPMANASEIVTVVNRELGRGV